MLRTFFAVLLIASLAACQNPRPSQMLNLQKDSGFVTKVNARGRTYALFIPANRQPNRKYPMIVFLHGVGEGGSNINGPLDIGIGPQLAKQVNTFDFFVLFPQSPSGGWDENGDAAVDVIDEIQRTCKEYPIDQDRISLTGLSTGGYGAFAIGAKYRPLFAAIVPLCANEGDAKDATTLAKMNVWAFRNAGDPFVGFDATGGTLSAITAAGGKPQETVYPMVGHNCWEAAYDDARLYIWLRNTKRNKAGL